MDGNFLEVNLNIVTRLDCGHLSPEDFNLPYMEDIPQEHFVKDATVVLMSNSSGPAVQPSTLLLNRLHWYAAKDEAWT